MASGAPGRSTAERVNALANPRTRSLAIVATVVLAGELIALTLAWGAATLTEARIDELVVTVAVVAAAATAIAQVARSAGRAPEPGHRWMVGSWIVVAAMAANSVGTLPFGLTTNPHAIPEIDRALLYVLAWLLALAVGVLGAEAAPDARRWPFVLHGGIGALAIVGGWALPNSWLVGPDGVADRFVLLAAAVLLVAVVATIRWLFRWRERGSWSWTWSGTGLVLGTLGVLLQLVAELGNERIWAGSTGLLVSSLLVPGMGAVVASGAMASAHTLARRELREQLTTPMPVTMRQPDSGQHLPMLDALEVELSPVARVGDRVVMGSLAHAVLPGDAIGSDWWRSQAQALGLAGRLEAAMAARAVEAVLRADDTPWVVVPIRAEGVGDELVEVLTSASAANLVVALRGQARSIGPAFARLREADVMCGVWTAGFEPRQLGGIAFGDLALLVVDGRLADGMHRDADRRREVVEIVRQAHDAALTVMVEGVSDPQDLWLLEDLGVRWVAGPIVDRMQERDGTQAPSAEAVDLIEAAGLRDLPGPGRT